MILVDQPNRLCPLQALICHHLLSLSVGGNRNKRISATSSFAHFSYSLLICLCEQSGARKLSGWSSDEPSPVFTLTRHDEWQFCLQT